MTAGGITPLQQVYLAFTNFGKGTNDLIYDMDMKAFAKLTRECGLVTKQCTPTDIELCFTKCKDKKDRRISYQQFERALQMLADKKRKSKIWVVNKILQTDGPLSYATKSEPVRFHDDKSSYTGVWKRGGPSTNDGKRDLSALLDRSPADVRGLGGDFRKPPPKHKVPSSYYMVHRQKLAHANWGNISNAIHATTLMKAVAQNAAARGTKANAIKAAGEEEEEHGALKTAFLHFARYGKGPEAAEHMCGSNFRKTLKDCKLVPSDMPDAAIDLIFIGQRFQGWISINFEQFKDALKLLADKAGLGFDKACGMVIYSGGPISYATEAEKVPFYDDKTKYTGCMKYGDILTMKKEIQKKAAEAAAAVEAAEEAKNRRIRTASELKRANSTSGRQTPTYLPRIHPKAPYEAPLPIIRPGTSPQSLPGSKVKNPRLYGSFLAFANHGRTGGMSQKFDMDGTGFHKLVTDCKLMGRDLQSHEVDLIFARVKEKKQRSIGYEAFQDALSIVAEKKGQTIGTIINLVSQVGRPAKTNVTRTLPVQAYMRPKSTSC